LEPPRVERGTFDPEFTNEDTGSAIARFVARAGRGQVDRNDGLNHRRVVEEARPGPTMRCLLIMLIGILMSSLAFSSTDLVDGVDEASVVRR
jgi:hypothetical protein